MQIYNLSCVLSQLESQSSKTQFNFIKSGTTFLANVKEKIDMYIM